MHLLNTSSLKLEYFDNHDVPPYAILSHCWGREEVTFQDVQSGNASEKAGYKKIKGSCSLAKSHGFEYAWVDTCCIDKTSSAELSEAINSMFLWYQEATVCYVYLADVPHRHCDDEIPTIAQSHYFRRSRWFRRGWTLQELLAPAMVLFFDQDWAEIGTKLSLSSEISGLTNVPEAVLEGTKSIDEISIATRMSWAAHRETARVEDTAYCLLGIFNINMPIMYGERERAFMRLQEEILKVTDDHSVFAWRHREGFHPRHSKTGAGTHFAYFPFEYLKGNIATCAIPFADTSLEDGEGGARFDKSIFVDNYGIHLRLPVVCDAVIYDEGTSSSRPEFSIDANYWLLLPCVLSDADASRVLEVKNGARVAIHLSRVEPGIYTRRECWFLTDEALAKCTPVVEGDGRVCIKRVQPVRRHPIQLVDAARKGNTTEVTFLLGRGVMDDCVYPAEEDILHKILGASLRTRELRERGLRPTALAYAVWEGREGAVKEMLRWPTGREQLSGPSGEGLLALAAMVGNAEMVDLLLQNGAGITEWTSRVLGDAARWGNEYVVRLLLGSGADCNTALPWMQGRSPLSLAAEAGHVRVMELLLDNGANVDQMDDSGRTSLSWATYSQKGSPVHSLLERKALAEVKDNDGRTPLSWAAQYGNQVGAAFLLAHGANSTEKDKRGLAPVHYARDYGNYGVVGLLLKHGAGSELPAQERRAIESCARYRDKSHLSNQEWMVERVPRELERIITARRKRWIGDGDNE